MAIDKTILVNDLRAVMADDPHVLVIGATGDIDCFKTNMSREIRYSEYGYGEEYKLSVVMAKEDVASIPDKGQGVTLDSEAFRVIGSEIDSMDIALTLHLGEAIP